MTGYLALGTVVRFAAAGLLLYAAARKLASPRAFRTTLADLRVPVAATAAYLVPLVEIVAAVALVVVPRQVFTAVVVAGLGLSFAGAAAVALRRGESIRCACYGESGDANLGARQIAALPAWLAVAAIALTAPDGSTSELRFVAALALVLALFVAARTLYPLARRNWSYLKVMEKQ